MLPTRRIAFDMVLMRPACVLVAAVMGADTQLPLQFDLDTWLLVPTDNMRVYEITHEQLINLVARVNRQTPTNHPDAGMM